ncbi:aprataxin-like protein [Sporothrix curviconia]|uniref:Aprataxin-like protein n=1 Tax=Sporothrix curviconia TaxID=1260050 RepID=A0ABP0BS01_9PEZI
MASQEKNSHLASSREAEPAKQQQNAFAQLMASKGRPKPKPRPRGGGAFRGIADAGFRKFQSREALGMYIDNPAAFMGTMTLGSTTGAGGNANANAALTVAGQVISYSDNFVRIHDKFPKASVHCLLLPRDRSIYKEHPIVLLSRRDAEGVAFLETVRAEAEKLKGIVAGELRRRFGQFSAADAKREAVLRGDAEPTAGQLPTGRDWSKEVIVGVHARPSMSHVHVHVFSRDMHSEKLRHRKHYNSFTTPFLVRLDEFPLAPDDPRQPYAGRAQGGLSADMANDADGDNTGDSGNDGSEGESEGKRQHLDYLQNDMRCWRCGKNFGNKFQELKRHLDIEFEAWKKE